MGGPERKRPRQTCNCWRPGWPKRAPPLWLFLPVFQPQETKGHAFAGQFLADVLHYGKAPLLRRLCRMGRKQEGFQTAVIEVRRQGPSQTSLLRPVNVFSA